MRTAFDITKLRKEIEKRVKAGNLPSRDFSSLTKAMIDIDKYLGSTKEGEWAKDMKLYVEAYKGLEEMAVGDGTRFGEVFGGKVIFDNRKKKVVRMRSGFSRVA